MVGTDSDMKDRFWYDRVKFVERNEQQPMLYGLDVSGPFFKTAIRHSPVLLHQHFTLSKTSDIFPSFHRKKKDEAKSFHLIVFYGGRGQVDQRAAAMFT